MEEPTVNLRSAWCNRLAGMTRRMWQAPIVLVLCLALPATARSQQGVVQRAPAEGTQVQAQGRPPVAGDEVPTDDGEDFRGLHLPSNRTASRGLAMAAERIHEGQFSQAIRFLDRLLGDEEDAFADDQVGARHFAGLKAEARRMLGSLPKVARDDYVATYGATARNRLEAAIAAGDLSEVQRIARQYFHTPAGYEASFILAMYERDMGRPLAASVLLQELIDTEQAVALLGPQLLLHAAITWRDAGQLDQARMALVRLKERFASAEIVVSGQRRALFSAEQDPLEWLDLVAGEAVVDAVSRQEHWTTYRGNAARNGVADGGVPHMRVRWRARVINSPQLEEMLASLRRGYQRRGVVTLPAAQPIAVGDVVLMRTAKNLVGVDFNSGNLIWDVRAEPDDDFKQLLAAAENSDAAETTPHLAYALERRMWDDAIFGTISSDGERVYVVRGLGLSLAEDANSRRLGGFAGGGFRVVRGRMVLGDDSALDESPTNTLTAVELRSEGKRVWEINGSDVGGELEGAFFLGPPLCVDGRLHVLAEIKGSIYLVVLRNVEARPHWELDWMQQLASVEVGIDLDPLRRFAGAMPSMQGGVLICPTSAGVVVAVDVTKRSLLWAYRYPLREQDIPQMAGLGVPGGGFVEAPGVQTNDRWLDATAVLAEGKALITPRESGELHCLDLATGDLLWKRNREDGLFIAGVHDGVVAIVGTDRMRGVRLDDGLRAWERDHTLFLNGAQPSGRGFLSDGKYFLPLTSAEVVAIDMKSGEIASRVRSRNGQVLGNLIAHRGAIVAQSELLLEKYDQKDAFRERTEALLADDPSDPVALRNLGELALAEGDVVEATTFLKGSLARDPANRETNEMLAQALLQGLAEDFSRFRDDLSLARRLANEPADQARLARVTAAGLHSTGEVLAAFESYAQLAAIDMEAPQVQAMSADWEVRTSRWIRAELGELWEAASEDERARFTKLLHERSMVPDDGDRLDKTAAFLEYFGGMPTWNRLALEDARRLVRDQPGLNAELAISALTELRGSHNEAWSLAAKVELLHALGRHADARLFEGRLLRDFAETTVYGAETGSQLIQRLHELYPHDDPAPWPRGRVLVERDMIRDSEPHDRFQSWRVDGPVDPSLYGYRYFFDQVQHSLVMVGPYGNVELSVPLLGSDDGNGNLFTRGRCHAALSGHLMIASCGEKIMAIDLLDRSSYGNVLWEAPTIEAFEGLAAQVSYPQFAQRTRGFGEYGRADWGHAQDESGRPLGWIGPVGPGGVVFQAQGELRSVDPLTGTINWLRRDVPPGCVLFGDDEYVFALPHQETEAVVFRASDGKRLGTRKVPPLEDYYGMDGRRILHWSSNRSPGGPPQAFLELVDAWTGEAVWTRQVGPDAQVCLVEGDWVGVVDRAGTFQLIDISSGDVMLSQQVLSEPTLRRIFVFRSRDHVILVTDRYAAQPGRRGPRGRFSVSSIYDQDYPIVTGRVYVFDRETGRPVLPVPAEVDQQGLAVCQPVELPVLGFVCHTRAGGGQGNRTNISVLLMNKATGSSIEPLEPSSKLFFPDATTTRFRMYREAEDSNVLMVDMANHRVRLEFTDEAAPPEPPADSDVEGGRNRSGGGGVFRFFGIGDASTPRMRR